MPGLRRVVPATIGQEQNLCDLRIESPLCLCDAYERTPRGTVSGPTGGAIQESGGRMRSRVLLACALLLAVFQVADAQTRLVAIVVDFPTSIPTDAQYLQGVRDDVAAVDQFNFDQSYGLAPQVTNVVYVGVIDAAPILATQDYSSGIALIAYAAQAAAIDQGVDLSIYGWGGSIGDGCHCMYFFPQPYEFGATWGVAGVGNATGMWFGGAFQRTSTPGQRVLAHEEGHHFGIFWEQEGLDCSDQTPLGFTRGATCVVLRYFDSIDVMGFGNGQFNALAKCYKGWLPCPSPSAFGDYVLEPFEQFSGTRSIVVDVGSKRLPLPITLEYRQPIGADANLPWVSGANVYNGVIGHISYSGQSGLTKLLRLHPDDPAYSQKFSAPALKVGETVCFPDSRKGITVLSASPAGAVVRFGRCR